MHEIRIGVFNKIAMNEDPKNQIVVCDNTDYEVVFTFDSEWDRFATKTARFAYRGQYQDIVFNGNRCAVPKMSGSMTAFYIGVYAGNLHTTTAATVFVRKSALTDEGLPDDPKESVVAQLMDAVGGKSNIGHTHSFDELTEKPVIPDAYDDAIAEKAPADHTHSYNDLLDKPEGDGVELDYDAGGNVSGINGRELSADVNTDGEKLASVNDVPKSIWQLQDGNRVESLETDVEGKADRDHTHSYESLTGKPEIPAPYDDTEIRNAVSALKDDVADKLTKPESGIAVGKYFRVAAVDELGNPVLEAVDLPFASQFPETAGIVKIQECLGIGIDETTHKLAVKKAAPDQVANKFNTNRPLTPEMQDDIVRNGLISNSKITDADKPLICETIGAEYDGVAQVIDEFTLDSDEPFVRRAVTQYGKPYDFRRVRIYILTPYDERLTNKDLFISVAVNTSDTQYGSQDSLITTGTTLTNTATYKRGFVFDINTSCGIVDVRYFGYIGSSFNGVSINPLYGALRVALANRITSFVISAYPYQPYIKIPKGTIFKIIAM